MWQPIETAPYDRVLVWIDFDNPELPPRSGVVMPAIKSDDGWRDDDGSLIHDAYRVTHWQPVPLPPSIS